MTICIVLYCIMRNNIYNENVHISSYKIGIKQLKRFSLQSIAITNGNTKLKYNIYDCQP